MLTTPVSYPADGTAMNTLRKSAANIRLGEYIADATAESIARYGLDTPRLVIRLHQAAGTIGAVGTTGSYATTDYPEATITLVIGEQESDLVDYVLYNGGIYRCSTLLLRGVMNADWQETITRYPVLTALGNLASLSRETADGVDTWVITRTEQVAENNDLVTDDEGESGLRYYADEKRRICGLHCLFRCLQSADDGHDVRPSPRRLDCCRRPPHRVDIHRC